MALNPALRVGRCRETMPSVLIVDDEPDVRTVVGLSLEAEGFEVSTVPDGTAALASIAAAAPDAVLMDIMMPGMDGFELLSAMREAAVGQSARVVMMTCRTSERDHLRAWDLGADGYLTKPFDPGVLADLLQRLLGSTPEALQARRLAELEQAALLDRLELAASNSRRSRRRLSVTAL
jgi:DNA-binding response OmpR family regulator